MQSTRRKSDFLTKITQFFFNFIYLLLRERGRKGEKHQCMRDTLIASCTPPAGDQACNPGMCPDCEPNQQLFNSKAGTQSTEPHLPGRISHFLNPYMKNYKMVSIATVIFNFPSISACITALHLTGTNL